MQPICPLSGSKAAVAAQRAAPRPPVLRASLRPPVQPICPLSGSKAAGAAQRAAPRPPVLRASLRPPVQPICPPQPQLPDGRLHRSAATRALGRPGRVVVRGLDGRLQAVEWSMSTVGGPGFRVCLHAFVTEAAAVERPLGSRLLVCFILMRFITSKSNKPLFDLLPPQP